MKPCIYLHTLHLLYAKFEELILKMEGTMGSNMGKSRKNREIIGQYSRELAVKCHNGIFLGDKEESVISYKGIPYAMQPVGKLRWKAPKEAPESEKVYEAYHYGACCIQSVMKEEEEFFGNQGEDCLNLNVWLNEENKQEKKPVMVYIHGGSYCWGGTTDPLLDGHNFVKEHGEVILITIGYRLGIMGFVDFSTIPGGQEYKDSCNLGILDQIAALTWIKKNVEAFGGDPSNVTIFGESAGAGSVSILTVLPRAKGLFKRAIMESGSSALTYSKEQCQPLTKQIMKLTKSENMQDLQKLSIKELREIAGKVSNITCFPQRDGRILPLDLYAQYAAGASAHVDILMGTNADEVRYWMEKVHGEMFYRMEIPILYENNVKCISHRDKKRIKEFFALRHESKAWKITEFYNEVMFRLPALFQLTEHSKNGGKSYNYYWTQPGKRRRQGAFHTVEIAYVFHNVIEANSSAKRFKPAVIDENTDKDKILKGKQKSHFNENLSQMVQTMWVNFAKSGDPSIEGFTWPEYVASSRKTMILGKECRVVEDLLEEQRRLLMPILKYHIKVSYTGLSLRVPQVYKILLAGVVGLFTLVRACLHIWNRKGAAARVKR